MADNRITQPSLTAGELSPSLYGRKDLAKRAVGVKRLSNMFVHATGGASNRAGLRFVGDIGAASEASRIMRFESAADEAFLTVWKGGKMLPVYRGSFVQNGAGRYEVTSPYNSSHLQKIYMDQSNDVATITHSEMPVYELGRYGINDWRFSEVDFASRVPIPFGVSVQTTFDFTDVGDDKKAVPYEYRVSAINENGEESLPSNIVVSGNLVFGYSKNYNTISWEAAGIMRGGTDAGTTNAEHSGLRIDLSYKIPNNMIVRSLEMYSAKRLGNIQLSIMHRPSAGNFERVAALTLNHRGGGWGKGNLSAPFTIPATGDYYVGVFLTSSQWTRARGGGNMAWQTGNIGGGVQAVQEWSNGSAFPTGFFYQDPVSDSENIIREYVVYKGKNGVFGSIGRTPNLTFKDDNIAPDMTQGVVQGNNPFSGSGKYPSIVFFSQQRRGFAHTNERPQTIWLSSSANYRSMHTSEPSRASDSIEFTLAAERKQDIFHVVSLEKGLIVLTRSGEWKVMGRDGDILSPESIFPMPQSRYGADERNRPIVAGESLLFVSRTGGDVLSMEYSFDIDRYKATNLTLLSRHLFQNKKIVAWDYAEDPDGIIYCVMEDGTVNSLTYLKEHDVIGWATFETNGKVTDVAVVPEAKRDVPYFTVVRDIQGGKRKYLEFLEDRAVGDIEDCFFLDSGLTYDKPMPVSSIGVGLATSITISNHGLVEGDTIVLSGNYFFNSENENKGNINGYYTVGGVHGNKIGILYTEALANEYEIGDPVDSSAFLNYFVNGGVVRKCVDTISGLDHLEGRRVVGLCDGGVVDEIDGLPIVVKNGAIPKMNNKYGRIHFGLAYRSVVETLDLASQQGDDTGIVKNSGKVIARFEKSRGVKCGQIGRRDMRTGKQELIEFKPRSYENYNTPPSLLTGIDGMENNIDWDTEIELMFVQDDPLPFTLTGVTIEYEYGGS